ncbi:hypothetical protein EVAR_32019_1 [Eumeta japonica]|uniref:Craniofacial development protein 2 n=1 Tax=Eumeta variegata TaxID=151549 RepID=A0A4C1YLW4_EUMVA|nr:hypothetical protein EVAR_32019_1 [Eumeta japonica]
MGLKGKIVMEPSNSDPSILIGLALIRVDENAAMLVSSYQKDHLNVERKEFLADVRDILVKCDKNQRIVILGDFNVWVGVQQDGYEKVSGEFEDERSNENDGARELRGWEQRAPATDGLVTLLL